MGHSIIYHIPSDVTENVGLEPTRQLSPPISLPTKFLIQPDALHTWVPGFAPGQEVLEASVLLLHYTHMFLPNRVDIIRLFIDQIPMRFKDFYHSVCTTMDVLSTYHCRLNYKIVRF